jgi:pimeloyl-ACP methyl ester carboxylesterase
MFEMNTRNRRIWGVLLVCLVGLGMSAGCQRFTAPEAPPTAPALSFRPGRGITEVECPFNIPFESDLKATCGTVEVPEDYAQTEGRKIELFVAIIHSTGANPFRDPVVFLPQYAGLSLLDMIGYIGFQLGDVLEERDLVYMEYRGLGHSGPELDCPEFTEAYFQTWRTKPSPDVEVALYEEAVNICRERLINAEIDPSKYSVNEVAADLSVLRLVLGYDPFNLLTGRFGAEVAFIMLRDYPQAVRSVAIFEAAFPMPYLRAEMEAISLQNSLDLLFNACLTDEECRLAYPDLESALYGSVDQLNLSPAEIKIFFPGENNLTPVKVTGDDLLLLIDTMLMSSRTIANIPKMLDEVAHGNVKNISDELQTFRMQQEAELVMGPEISAACTGLHASFFQETPASQDVQPVVMDAIQNSYAYLGRICPIWTGSQPGMPAGQPIRSDAPVLIIQGQFTPSLSPDLVSVQMREMKNVLHVVVPNRSVDVIDAETCSLGLLFDWLRDPGSNLNTDCVNDVEPIDFAMP